MFFRTTHFLVEFPIKAENSAFPLLLIFHEQTIYKIQGKGYVISQCPLEQALLAGIRYSFIGEQALKLLFNILSWNFVESL